MAKTAVSKSAGPAQGALVNIEPDIDTTEEVALALADGSLIRDFTANVVAFFKKARAIEASAIATRDYAKTLATTPLTTAEQDAAIQTFLKGVTLDKRTAEEHWNITAIVSKFHRRLTSKRAIATDALDEASTIGNRLHNNWTESEKRRVAAETERRRLEEEQAAQKRRDEELARLEAEAVKREEAMTGLSEREQLFIDLYTSPGVAMGNGRAAAERAGFKDGLKTAARLLTLAKITGAIQAKKEAAAIRDQAVAVKHLPLEVEEVEEIKPNIIRAGGSFDRTTVGGEIVDAVKFVDAFAEGGYGIPRELLVAFVQGRGQAELNAQARSVGKRIERWPGVRFKSNTKVI